MTLATTVEPLAVYAIAFQTALYISLPRPLRTKIAPLVTGLVGAGLCVVAGAWFGFEPLGLVGGSLGTTLLFAAVAVALVGVIASMMMSRPDLRSQLADSRLAALSPRAASAHIFIRIPVFTALIEEAVFRGVLHSALMTLYPTGTTVWLGAGLFGLWHIGPGIDQAQAGGKSLSGGALHTAVTVVSTTLAGAFLVWLRIETGSIWVPVAVHAGTNMTLAVFGRRAARVSQV